MSGPLKRIAPGCQYFLKHYMCNKNIPMRTFLMRRGGEWDPFSELQSSFNRMERDFNQFFCIRNDGRRFFDHLARRIPLSPTDGSTHRINLDLSGCAPEDVKISVNGRVVKVDAHLDYKDNHGGRLYQEVSRQFTLPDNIDIEKIKSVYSRDHGILTLEAPFLNNTAVENPVTEIPITIEKKST